jgi:hypothetical protein
LFKNITILEIAIIPVSGSKLPRVGATRKKKIIPVRVTSRNELLDKYIINRFRLLIYAAFVYDIKARGKVILTNL